MWGFVLCFFSFSIVLVLGVAPVLAPVLSRSFFLSFSILKTLRHRLQLPDPHHQQLQQPHHDDSFASVPDGTPSPLICAPSNRQPLTSAITAATTPSSSSATPTTSTAVAASNKFVTTSIPDLHPEYAQVDPCCFVARTDSACVRRSRPHARRVWPVCRRPCTHPAPAGRQGCARACRTRMNALYTVDLNYKYSNGWHWLFAAVCTSSCHPGDVTGHAAAAGAATVAGVHAAVGIATATVAAAEAGPDPSGAMNVLRRGCHCLQRQLPVYVKHQQYYNCDCGTGFGSRNARHVAQPNGRAVLHSGEFTTGAVPRYLHAYR